MAETHVGAVDFRLRPPLPGAIKSFLYDDVPGIRRRCAARGMEVARVLETQALADVVAEMDAAGVGIGVVPARLGSARIGSITNEEVHSLVESMPDRFVGFASPDPDDLDGFVAGLEERVKGQGFRGINLEPGSWERPEYIDSTRLEPLYSEAERLEIPVMIMAGGDAGPDISYTDPVHIDRMSARFRRLPIIAAHGGWPWVNHILHIAYRRQNVIVSPDSYLFGMAGWRDYVDAGNGFLSERMVFGTSFPILPLTSTVAMAREFFRPEVVEKILSGNGRRILGLE